MTIGKTYDAMKGQFVVPIIDGLVVPHCRKITIYSDGTAEAMCHKLNERGEPFLVPEGTDVETVTLRGHGYVIPIHPGDYNRVVTEQKLKEMSLEVLKQ